MIPELGLGLLALAGLALGVRAQLRLREARSQLDQALEAQAAQRRQLHELSATSTRRDAEERELRAYLARGTAERSALSEELAMATAQALAQREEAEALRSSLASSEAERQRLIGALDAQSRELETARADRRTLSESRRSLTETLQQLEQEKATLTQALARGQRTYTQLEAERARLAHEVEQLHEAASAHREDGARIEALEQALAEAQAELERLREAPPETANRAALQQIQALERRLREGAEQLEVLRARAELAEAQLAEQQGEGAELAMVRERDALRGRVRALEDSLRRVATTRAALRALGVPAAAPDAEPFSVERRERSEALLRDTYLAAGAAAASVLDRRGVAWARCGNAPVLERLAASATLLRRAEVEPALGRPAQLMSELFGAYGRHLVRLGPTDFALALTGSRECPALPLRLAALQLVGADPLPVDGAEPPEVLDLHPERSDNLGAWAARRGALAAAVFTDGEPAATDSLFAGACAPLVEATLALHRRADRDGFAAGFALLWRGEDDVCLAARVQDGAVIFAKFNAPPAPRVLDDMLGTLRWLDAARAS
ncbi:MAG: hypothetical protein H6741_05890 [Alphaproteobacteria bacterium]|nr:hypothetical protein [Alphaproteobacteria bacterium]MCB9792239.1 hypothetical protein [Alphaproteobacteria bacterium]